MDGIRQFVVGTGGRFLRPVQDIPEPNSEAINNTTFGVLRVVCCHGATSGSSCLPPAARTPTPASRAATSPHPRCPDRVVVGGASARAMEATPATQSAAPTERQITVSGLRTRLFEAGPPGAAEAVVFVHGNPGVGGRLDRPGRTHGRIRARRRLRHARLRARGQATEFRVLGARRNPVPRRCAVGARHRPRALRAARPRWAVGSGMGRRPSRSGRKRRVDQHRRLLDYKWHFLARLWQTPVVGELFMATANRTAFRTLSNRGQKRKLPREYLDRCTTTSTATPAAWC